jgi:hypothetical protein
MLQKFLFIGVGGSGGKTLRIVHDDLRRLLARHGYKGPFPEAWQFVQIDVPVDADGNTPDLPRQLPVGKYVGLAPAGVNYTAVDQLLVGRGPSVQMHTAGWRPDPPSVMVDPSIGAGQYRGVGRVVAGASMTRIVEKLREAISSLEDVSVNAQFGEVATRLGVPDRPSNLPPKAIIVSSIAGGSGSGVFLDVCDALRMIKPEWGDKSAALLFTPDVFGDLKEAQRGGVNPNALAAVSELIAGCWNNEPPSPNEFPMLETAGVHLPDMLERRGPYAPLLIGRSNGQVTFGSQIDTYRVAARMLVNWVTSPSVQSQASESAIGNWGSTGSYFAQKDRLPIADGRVGACNSMGFAIVSLGRDVFAKYAAERLARGAAERILRGHWTADVPDRKTPDAACSERADQLWTSFLEECGLNERTREANQIVDAIRGTGRLQFLADLKRDIQSSVTSGRSSIPGDTLEQLIVNERKTREKAALDGMRTLDQNGAKHWINQIQPRVVDAVATVIGRHGAPVAVAVLDRVIIELREITHDLRRDAEFFGSQSNGVIQKLHHRIMSFGAAFLTGNPEIPENIKVACDEVFLKGEEQLHSLTSTLVADFIANFMVPLRFAVENGKGTLVNDELDTPSSPSIVKAWVEVAVPERMMPAQNEVFLEKVDTYPEIFMAKVASTLGVEEPGTALMQAIEQVITGGAIQTMISIQTRWAAEFASFTGGPPPSAASFRVALGAESLLDRADEWISVPDTAIGRYVDETLVDYLKADGAMAAEHSERLAAFRRGFAQAMSTSLPLIRVDSTAVQQTYGISEIENAYWVSEIPFPAGHPAREVAMNVLQEAGISEQAAGGMFGDARVSGISITTHFAGAVHPSVFSSLIGPIKDEVASKLATGQMGDFWSNRRARPLAHAVPMPPARRRAFLRGWFIARLLELIEVSDKKPVRVCGPDGWMSFPYPLLGKPVTRIDQLASALLETMPLAMFDSAPNGLLASYGFLCELGATFGNPKQEESLPKLLADWLESGQRPKEAPAAPSLELFTSDAQRREESLRRLREVQAHFTALSSAQSMKAEDLLYAPRSWELRDDIENALQAVISIVATGASGSLSTSGPG